MQGPIPPPRVEELLSPLLSSLPAASISSTPPDALLPSLSPILRQRVQVLSSGSNEPWLPLLSYDSDSNTSAGLEKVAKSERLEPHPVSGEVEVDWEYDVAVRYRRVDEETLQALVSLEDLGLSVRLVWCVNDEVGGGDGWRIGEVSVFNKEENGNWGGKSVADAETQFKESRNGRSLGTSSLLTPQPEPEDEEEEEDDSYWAQYDSTPARTPALPKGASPAPRGGVGAGLQMSAAVPEEEYYAQYATVQPAMDNHDPDEALENGEVESSLQPGDYFQNNGTNGHARDHSISNSEVQDSAGVWGNGQQHINGFADSYSTTNRGEYDGQVRMMYNSSTSHPHPLPNSSHQHHDLAHPRPASSPSSNGSDTVARLEREVEENSNRDKSEVGIKRHIGASVKSLYRLARVAGIEPQEFQRIVRTELEFLEMMGDEEV